MVAQIPHRVFRKQDRTQPKAGLHSRRIYAPPISGTFISFSQAEGATPFTS